ncbi:class C sortase [Roseburia hominis]
MRRGGIVRKLLIFLLFEIAIILLIYPYLSNYLFENRADSIVSTVNRITQEADDSERQSEMKAARNYNHMIAGGHIQLKDPFIEDQLHEEAGEYASLLSMTEDGVMGFLEIPSIAVSLPIYHGTSERVLENGAGHLQGTSLPIGGEGTHTVLTGHTGLSHAKLFSDLTELVKGDIFFLNVWGERLAYEVDQINVVLPGELSNLRVESGKDYCTLVTCTPYGVNTHRLLVRGSRTEAKEGVEKSEILQEKKRESRWLAEYKLALRLSGSCFVICLLVMKWVRYFRKGQR